MSAKKIAEDRIWEIGLSPSEFVVLLRVVTQVGLIGVYTKTLKETARDCFISTRTASNAFSTLESLGIIAQKCRKKTGQSNLVKVLPVQCWKNKEPN